jgi:hypothetical protein
MVAVASRTRPHDPVFWNQDELERATGLPVLASVFPARKPDARRAARSRIAGVAGAFVRAGDLVMLLFVAFVIYCSVVDSAFIDRFRVDPVSTYITACHRHSLILGDVAKKKLTQIKQSALSRPTQPKSPRQ